MTLVWPIAALPPQAINADIAPRSLAGPAALSGGGQVTSSDAGLWRVVYANIVVHGNQKLVLWHAIAAKLEGRAVPIVVPIPARGRRPTPAGADESYADVPHSDDSTFSDGTGYVGSTIEVALAAPVALRAVTATVDVAYAGELQPGQIFSIGERLYRLHSVAYVDADTAQIEFRPPLREAAEAGARLDFDRPVCRVRLVSDQEMDLPFGANLTVFPTLNFIEDLL